MKRAVTEPLSIWTQEEFAGLIAGIVNAERETNPSLDVAQLRRMVVRDITLHSVPAGNA